MPEGIAALKGKEKVAALSALARGSAKASALKSNFDFKEFKKNAGGAPVPSNNIYWSVSHKPDFVAGVVSKNAIGIDVEIVS